MYRHIVFKGRSGRLKNGDFTIGIISCYLPTDCSESFQEKKSTELYADLNQATSIHFLW